MGNKNSPNIYLIPLIFLLVLCLIPEVLSDWDILQGRPLYQPMPDFSEALAVSALLQNSTFRNSSTSYGRPMSSQPTTSTPLNTKTVAQESTAATINSCIPSKTIFKGKHTCKDTLIFEDHFNNLNNQIWKKEIRIPLETEGAEFVLYQNYPENCYTQNGKLYILPKLLTEFPEFNEYRLRTGEIFLGSHCTGAEYQECFRNAVLQAILPPVVSCKLNTKDSFSFKYGKVEIRAKFPKGDWIFPQLYLEPVEKAYGLNGYASGQMRIGFIRGNEILESKEFVQINGNRLSGGFILSARQQFRDLWMESIQSERHFADDFHIYTLTWTNQYISVAVDGTIYGNYKSTIFRRQAEANNLTYVPEWNTGGRMAPFDKEFYLSLGVAVGGMLDFPDMSINGLTNTLKPWNNTSPKSEYNFWLNKNSWHPTWRNLNAAMKIDYVKVWAV